MHSMSSELLQKFTRCLWSRQNFCMACAMCVDIKKKRETAVIITELILDPHMNTLASFSVSQMQWKDRESLR